MSARRKFLKRTGQALGAVTFGSLSTQAKAEKISEALASMNQLSPLAAATDESLWDTMAQAYTVSPNVLN